MPASAADPVWSPRQTTPTAHAEIVAIRDACSRLGSFSPAGCEIYTSCEPCPMCLAAVYWARLERIWYAATRQEALRAFEAWREKEDRVEY